MYDDVELTWGEEDSFFFMDGDGGRSETLALCLDETRGSGFKSKGAYLYGRFDVDIKLVAGNSAGLITTFYVSSIPYLYACVYRPASFDSTTSPRGR
jgi:xyloglucan:xyloglucosyl transferase